MKPLQYIKYIAALYSIELKTLIVGIQKKFYDFFTFCFKIKESEGEPNRSNAPYYTQAFKLLFSFHEIKMQPLPKEISAFQSGPQYFVNITEPHNRSATVTQIRKRKNSCYYHRMIQCCIHVWHLRVHTQNLHLGQLVLHTSIKTSILLYHSLTLELWDEWRYFVLM